MRKAVSLAKRGAGNTSPNPAVGAVIVRKGRIVGRGYHKKAGLAHAEINALLEAGIKARGADMYVTLEPCDHFGKTPPCTDAVIKAGIRKVFIGMKDPNPLVSGKGIRRLRSASIKAEAGILENECRDINEAYIKYITTKTPFVTLKLAVTLDGKIAAATGESKWITGNEARKFAHRIRANVDAVMVGIGTILKDDPKLTTRLVKGKDPVRIVVDSALKIPITANVVNAGKGGIIIATAKDRGQRPSSALGGSGEVVSQKEKKVKVLKEKGVEVLPIPSRNGLVDLKVLMRELGKRGIMSLMIEGGSSLAASAIKQGIVDKLAVFVAPKILGKQGLPMIGNLGIKSLKNAVHLNRFECKKIGKDILLQGYVT